jgi:DNA-binding SARP family transcriptional activator
MTEPPHHHDQVKRIRIYTLGRFLVARDAGDGTPPAPIGPALWRHQRTQQVLKCLIAMPNGQLRVDEAAYLVWPEEEAAVRAVLLRRAVQALRRLLGEGAAPVLANDLLTLPPAPRARLWIDADAFEGRVAAARTVLPPSSTRRLRAYAAALRLYAGEFLPDDQAASWSYQRREALRDLWLAAGCEMADLLVAQDQRRQAAALLRRLHGDAPIREDAALRLAALLAHQGDGAAALLTLRTTQNALWQARAERGSPALQAMLAALERGEAPFSETYPTMDRP